MGCFSIARVPSSQGQRSSSSSSSSSSSPLLDGIFLYRVAAMELHSNKKPRGEYSTNKRWQAPRKTRHSGCSYLKPGALAQLRDAQLQKHGRKRSAESEALASSEDGIVVQRQQQQQQHQQLHRVGNGNVHSSPERVPTSIAPRAFGPACLQRKKLLAPKFTLPTLNLEALPPPPAIAAAAAAAVAPPSRAVFSPGADGSSAPPLSEDVSSMPMDDIVQLTPEPYDRFQAQTTGSLLESLPPELLVRIVCRLDHNELKPVFHTCRALRYAVLIAKQCHFNFTTPGKAAQEDHSQRRDQALPFLSDFVANQPLPTPNAPKHALKAPEPRISVAEMREIAATLFQGSQLSVTAASNRHRTRPPKLPSRSGASHRVLFNEEELCQAIAQNTL